MTPKYVSAQNCWQILLNMLFSPVFSLRTSQKMRFCQQFLSSYRNIYLSIYLSIFFVALLPTLAFSGIKEDIEQLHKLEQQLKEKIESVNTAIAPPPQTILLFLDTLSQSSRAEVFRQQAGNYNNDAYLAFAQALNLLETMTIEMAAFEENHPNSDASQLFHLFLETSLDNRNRLSAMSVILSSLPIAESITKENHVLEECHSLLKKTLSQLNLEGNKIDPLDA